MCRGSADRANTLQITATHTKQTVTSTSSTSEHSVRNSHAATHCNTLQHTATHCYTPLQLLAAHVISSVHIYIHKYKHTYTHKHTNMHIYRCYAPHLCIHTYTHTSTHTHTSAHVYTVNSVTCWLFRISTWHSIISDRDSAEILRNFSKVGSNDIQLSQLSRELTFENFHLGAPSSDRSSAEPNSEKPTSEISAEPQPDNGASVEILQTARQLEILKTAREVKNSQDIRYLIFDVSEVEI